MNEEVLSSYNSWHQSMSLHEEEDILNLPWYKTVVSLLPDLNGKKVLEVGCGRGVFGNYLASRFPQAQIVAIDFSKSAIDIASQRYKNQNLSFYVGDAESLQFDSEEFDYYISCETIEHVLHPAKMIDEVNRVLKKGGNFIITTENYFNAYFLVWIKCWIQKKPFESGCGVQPHENFFIFPMILNMLRKSRLTVTHTESNHYQWLVFPRVAPAKLCTNDIRSPILKFLFRPFGRHYTYCGEK